MVKDLTITLKECLFGGLKNGLKTWWWITKMMLPITCGVAILKWAGAINVLSEWMTPMFKYIGLSGEGVLVFLTGALSSLYGAIAVIATLNVDYRSATILAVMGLICHNLIVETIIQKKAGANGWYVVVLRIVAALFCAWLLNLLLPQEYNGNLIIERVKSVDGGFWATMKDWAIQMATLLPYMFALIATLQVIQQVLKRFDLIKYLIVPLSPLMKLFGLSKKSSFLWVILNTLGLTYGGAVLISEIENKEIKTEDAKLLNTHAALNHSLLEDTFLFAAIGLSLFWLVIPRVVLAIIAVWGERIFNKIKFRKV